MKIATTLISTYLIIILSIRKVINVIKNPLYLYKFSRVSADNRIVCSFITNPDKNTIQLLSKANVYQKNPY